MNVRAISHEVSIISLHRGVGMSLELLQAVSFHLIDPTDGRSLQTWSFTTPRITIGRGETESIALADPYVSRVHAEILWNGEAWQLFARGRNGVIVDGKSVAEYPLTHGAVFRLGGSGPSFRFDVAPVQHGQATLCFDSNVVILLAFNKDEVEVQANEVVETDYFQQLQRKARELRRQRSVSG